jgi:hypothetical protein
MKERCENTYPNEEHPSSSSSLQMFSTDRLWIQPSSSPENPLQLIDYCIFVDTIAGIFRKKVFFVVSSCSTYYDRAVFQTILPSANVEDCLWSWVHLQQQCCGILPFGRQHLVLQRIKKIILCDSSFKLPKIVPFYGALTDLSNCFTQ